MLTRKQFFRERRLRIKDERLAYQRATRALRRAQEREEKASYAYGDGKNPKEQARYERAVKERKDAEKAQSEAWANLENAFRR